MLTRSKRIFIVAFLLILALSGFQQTTDVPTNVQTVNTFLNIGQFGALMYLLWRSDNALMRQRGEQAEERKYMLGLLMSACKIRTQDE